MRTYPSLSKAEVSSDGMSGALEKLSEKSGTRAAARAVLDGRKKGLLALLLSWGRLLSHAWPILILATLPLTSREAALLVTNCSGSLRWLI